MRVSSLTMGAAALVLGRVTAKNVQIDPMKHDIQEIYQNNFDN